MKKEIIVLVASLGFTAAAAYLISRADPVITADSLIGFGAVAALLAITAIEYRISWKRLIGR